MSNRSQLDALTVESMEQALERMLRPVQPSPQFVDQLHRRLVTPPSFIVERNSKAVGLLILAAGLFSGLVVLVIARQVYRLVLGRKR